MPRRKRALAGGTAVIAGGIDIIIPENADFTRASPNRTSVAEMPPGTQPTPRISRSATDHRASRSRRGGRGSERSLITAREAGERGGEVMAIPARPSTRGRRVATT